MGAIRPIALAIVVFFQVPTVLGAQLHPWEPFEVMLAARVAPANPYAAVPTESEKGDLVTVTFTGISGEARGQRIRVVGFWDGGRTWRARFAPPAAGTWTYTSASEDPGLGAARGKITVRPSVYAVGSDAEAARLAGIEPPRVVFGVFVLMGALVGLAALLNAVRFSAVPSNMGLGLELKAIAAVVVGGTAITGGRGRLIGTLIGVALLGTIGTALTFVGINPFWERAIQGGIILAALVSDVALERLEHRVRLRPVRARVG